MIYKKEFSEVDMEELKPCNNCGCSPEVIRFWYKGTANRRHYFVRCSVCKYRPIKYGYSYKDVLKAIKNWNRSVEE